MGIPGGASGDRIKTNEIKPVIKAAGKKQKKERKKVKMSQTELGYHWKVDAALQQNAVAKQTAQSIIIFWLLAHIA